MPDQRTVGSGSGSDQKAVGSGSVSDQKQSDPGPGPTGSARLAISPGTGGRGTTQTRLSLLLGNLIECLFILAYGDTPVLRGMEYFPHVIHCTQGHGMLPSCNTHE